MKSTADRGDAPELGINHAGQTLFELSILLNRASLDT